MQRPQQVEAWLKKVRLKNDDDDDDENLGKNTGNNKKPKAWLKLPFHPALQDEVAKELKVVNADANCCMLYHTAFADGERLAERPEVSVSWRNALRSHSTVVSRACCVKTE